MICAEATPTETGWLASANAISQLLAAPIIGTHLGVAIPIALQPYRQAVRQVWPSSSAVAMYRWNPREVGRSLHSIILMRNSFVLLSVARSLPIILLSRILDGLLGGDVTLAQAYMTGALLF